VQRAIRLGRPLSDLSSSRKDYEKGGRLEQLSQAGGFGIRKAERDLSRPKKLVDRARRSGYTPPKPLGFHKARADALKKRLEQKRKRQPSKREDREKRHKLRSKMGELRKNLLTKHY